MFGLHSRHRDQQTSWRSSEHRQGGEKDHRPEFRDGAVRKGERRSGLSMFLSIRNMKIKALEPRKGLCIYIYTMPLNISSLLAWTPTLALNISELDVSAEPTTTVAMKIYFHRSCLLSSGIFHLVEHRSSIFLQISWGLTYILAALP